MLYPALVGSVTGSYKPETWRYNLKFPMPGENVDPIERNIAADGVVHIRNNWATAATPWKGVSPLVMAGTSATALANIETRLGHDANTRVLHIIPAPDGTPAARMQTLRTSLSQSRGNATLVESMAGGWGGGRLAAPSRDWEPRRVGQRFPKLTSCFAIKPRWASSGRLGPAADITAATRGQCAKAIASFRSWKWPLARLAEEECPKSWRPRFVSTLTAWRPLTSTPERAFDSFVRNGLTLEQALHMVGLGMPGLIEHLRYISRTTDVSSAFPFGSVCPCPGQVPAVHIPAMVRIAISCPSALLLVPPRGHVPALASFEPAEAEIPAVRRCITGPVRRPAAIRQSVGLNELTPGASLLVLPAFGGVIVGKALAAQPLRLPPHLNVQRQRLATQSASLGSLEIVAGGFVGAHPPAIGCALRAGLGWIFGR